MWGLNLHLGPLNSSSFWHQAFSICMWTPCASLSDEIRLISYAPTLGPHLVHSRSGAQVVSLFGSALGRDVRCGRKTAVLTQRTRFAFRAVPQTKKYLLTVSGHKPANTWNFRTTWKVNSDGVRQRSVLSQHRNIPKPEVHQYEILQPVKDDFLVLVTDRKCFDKDRLTVYWNSAQVSSAFNHHLSSTCYF